MLTRDFKTIVFFGLKFPQYNYIKEEFSSYPFVKVFQSNIGDEINQILTQSITTAILIKNTFHVSELAEQNILGMKEAGVRIYFLNDDHTLNRDQVEKLSLRRVTTLTDISDADLKAKLEMFLLSKLRLKDGPNLPSAPREVEEDPAKRSYFTHFKKVNDQWAIYASTHEQERDIETIFEKSWTVFCIDLIGQADKIVKKQENPNFSKDYLSIVYPHQFPDGTKGVSVMHVKKDSAFAETYQKAITFLAKI